MWPCYVINMATLSIKLRERILIAYDKGDSTRDAIAERFKVSLGMVKKLLQQRRHTGSIEPRHHLAGRKKLIQDKHRDKMRKLLERKPGLTLADLRTALRLKCTLPAIHYVLADMGLTRKDRKSAATPRKARPAARRAVSKNKRKAR